jgi:ribosomal protein S17
MTTEKSGKVEKVEIPAPKFRIAEINIVGAAPLVINKFSRKAREQIIATQKEGSRATGKKKREPKNFDEVYSGAMHLTHEGWSGVPAGAFRNAMISACRTVGYKMTHAKLAAFVLADGYDVDDETPLIRIYGEPQRHTTYARNDNGSVDIRVRPMWKHWKMTVRVRYDGDMFSHNDIINLMMRVGQQVGIGEGRPDSKNSAGMGWGLFDIQGEVVDVVAA